MDLPMIAERTLAMMRDVFAQYPDLLKVTLYGSRSTGRATERSDFDLVTHGICDDRAIARINSDLAELPIPQFCEVQAYERISYAPLKQNIDRDGIVIYDRDDPALQSSVYAETEGEPVVA